ncbi:MAG: lysophospholipid acyltransferase family protein [Chloroflexota bacterium]
MFKSKPVRWLQKVIVILIIRPILNVLVGINIKNQHRVPKDGPMIVVANHNSHMDTAVLMALFPLNVLYKVRPIAASDYWLKNRAIGWFATHIVNIIPIDRRRKEKQNDPLSPIADALTNGDIVIMFPEGSRGEPEQMSEFKSGVAHLSRRCPDVPVVPVFLRGMGKTLPRGTSLFLPFFCDVIFGQAFTWNGSKQAFMNRIKTQFDLLAQ